MSAVSFVSIYELFSGIMMSLRKLRKKLKLKLLFSKKKILQIMKVGQKVKQSLKRTKKTCFQKLKS